MKKLVVVLTLAMAAFTFQANAATIDLGYIESKQHFGNSVVAIFTDTYTFTAPPNLAIGAPVTYFGFIIKMPKIINTFAATSDSIPLGFTSSGTGAFNSQMLSGAIPGSSAGSHSLVISGTTNGNTSYGGDVADVAQTPTPAAMWLFGSALMGLTGVSRRKKA